MRRAAGPYLRLLRDGPFRSLLGSKLATRVATDALLYALLIHVVQVTGSARHTTLFVLVYTVPGVVFGLLAGVITEASSLRPLLLTGHAARVVIVGGMLALGSNLWWIYFLLFVFATVGQFVGPAEASALPRLVQAEERSFAHSLASSVTMVGTTLGAVLIGPLILAVLGWRAVVAFSAPLHFLAAVFAMSVRAPLKGGGTPLRRDTAAGSLLHGWNALRAHPDALLAFGYLTIAGALARVLIALAPYYSKDVLGINPENAVYIALPAAVGAVVALAATPILGRALGLRGTVDVGFFVLLLGLLSVGALLFVSNLVLTHVDLHIGYLERRVGPSSVITVTALMGIVIGLGGTMLGIVGSTTLNEIEPASQARVSSTRTTLSAAVSLVPLFAVAAVADLFGVRAVLLSVAVAALTAALYLRAFHRKLARADLRPGRALPPAG